MCADLINEGDLMLMDVTENRDCSSDPRRTWMKVFREQAPLGQKRKAKYRGSCASEPAMTKDGQRVELMVNAGLRDDVGALRCDGRGRHRPVPHRVPVPRFRHHAGSASARPGCIATCWMRRESARWCSAPSISAVTRPALPAHHDDDMARGKPGDGLAGAAPRLERDGLMKVQARALLEAAAGRDAQRDVPDGERTVGIRRRARPVRASAADGWSSGSKKAPAQASAMARCWKCRRLAEQLDMIAPESRFLSIGTNDLTQFLFAADRANPKLAERYDWLSVFDPAVPAIVS
jgi:phosphotransferase system enzyme I (PtsP)